MKLSLLFQLIAFTAVFAVHQPADSAILTLDFEQVEPDIGGGFVYANITSGGFRLSPGCHVHHMTAPGSGYNDSNWISWDLSGCLSPGTGNPDYVGEQPGDYLHVDYFGKPFTLESVYFVGFGLVKSSKGGEFATGFGGGDSLVSFDGPEWTGIKWLLFDGFDGGAPSIGIDQLTVRVSEPVSFTLFAAALVGLGSLPRRLGGISRRALPGRNKSVRLYKRTMAT